MSPEDDVRALLAPMAERAVDPDGADFRVDRERVLAGMAQASRRRPWPAAVIYAAAAAAVVGLVFGARLWQRGGGSASVASLEVAVSEGSATQIRGALHADMSASQTTHIAAEGELETGADSQARVRTTDGLQIELRSQTRVALSQLQPSAAQVTLLGGAIRCTVPHRTAPHAFQVVTPDVTVVDLGTVFTVSVDGPDRTTRISVEEGEVLVRQALGQTRLQAPNSWSSGASTASSPAPLAEPSAPSGAADLGPKPPDATPKGSRSSAPPRGEATAGPTLAQEAQLLRQGLAAERQGRFSDASSALTELLARYPHSPLVPDARAALARVQARAPR
jgi:TolA-binding protein